MRTVRIEGIGDRQSAGAVQMRGRWQGVVFFRPWKAEGGKVSKEVLRVLLPPRVASSAAMRECRSVQTGVAYRFEVELYPARKGMLRSGELRGKLVKRPGPGTLAEADARVAKRIVVRDARLGRLVREPRAEHFEGTLTVMGRRCALIVWGDDVAKAAALVRRLRSKLGGLAARIARQLVGLANDWRPEGEPEITGRELARRLKPTEASVDAKARALTLSFNCADTFTDHGVTATLTARGALKNVHIQ
jgi:hypothetical protein